MFPASIQNSSNVIKLSVLNHLSNDTSVSIEPEVKKKKKEKKKKQKKHHVFCTQISNVSSSVTNIVSHREKTQVLILVAIKLHAVIS